MLALQNSYIMYSIFLVVSVRVTNAINAAGLPLLQTLFLSVHLQSFMFVLDA